MSRNLAPVVVYTYSRLSHLQKTVAALQHNYLAGQSVLYIVSDGPKTEAHRPLIDKIREFVDSITGFREVVRIYRDRNLGTPASIHQAEEQVINDHGSVISMEDDNISSRNYLDFLNGGLEAYRDDPSVFSICGFCPPIQIPAGFSSEYWFHPWNMSWGYALWKEKYYRIYPLINELDQFKREGLLRKVRAHGGLCIADSLKLDYRKKRIYPDSILCAKMIREGMHSIIPTISKICNFGNDGTGVSGSRLNDKYYAKEDDRPVRDFHFGGKPEMNDRLVAESIKFYNGSLMTRASRHLGVYHELSTFKHWLQYKVIGN